MCEGKELTFVSAFGAELLFFLQQLGTLNSLQNVTSRALLQHGSIGTQGVVVVGHEIHRPRIIGG